MFRTMQSKTMSICLWRVFVRGISSNSALRKMEEGSRGVSAKCALIGPKRQAYQLKSAKAKEKFQNFGALSAKSGCV